MVIGAGVITGIHPTTVMVVGIITLGDTITFMVMVDSAVIMELTDLEAMADITDMDILTMVTWIITDTDMVTLITDTMDIMEVETGAVIMGKHEILTMMKPIGVPQIIIILQEIDMVKQAMVRKVLPEAVG